ncbi:transient receptor potential cation channel subfamily M member 2 isoform X2 [Patella vulgata]|uniref:transient receptor potential cation channel subfamily M member 2 isoform X2 n=1 Tax=Patella vulgata TaxID=6465 RepID=UPI0024A90F57|nr:transient receptor potential cation channel subfamily M member 2 isoform X2 [Patella vulgata]
MKMYRLERFLPKSYKEQQEKKSDGRWIQANIKLTCPKHEPEEKACRCKRPEEGHPRQYPCDVFGVEKTGNHKTKYVRIDREQMDKTVDLLLNIWKLPKPRFIIAFVGGNNENTEVPKGFCMGLTDLVEKLDMWVVTDGTTSGNGALNHIVKALKGTMLTGDPFSKSSRLIGVIPWSQFVSKHKDKLLFSEEPKDDIPFLDRNHTHFLFLDDESTKDGDDENSDVYDYESDTDYSESDSEDYAKGETDVECGTERENDADVANDDVTEDTNGDENITEETDFNDENIKEVNGKEEASRVNTGDNDVDTNGTKVLTDAEIVKQRTEFLFKLKKGLDDRLSKNIPLLLFVIKLEPGVIGAVLKAIDNKWPIILIKGVHDTPNKNKENKENGSKNVTQDKEDICGILAEALGEKDKDKGKQKILELKLDWLEPHIEKLFENMYLITCLDVHQKDIGSVVKDSILKGKYAGEQKNMEHTDTLRLMILWNTVKEAEDILDKHVKQVKPYMNKPMFDATRERRVAFIELFTNYGIDVDKCITVGKLKKLYHQETSAMKILENKKFVRKLRKLGYTLPGIILVKRKMTIPETKKSKENCRCIDLFVWSLVIRNKDLAKLFWLELEEPLAAAIFVNGFCELVTDVLGDNEKENLAEFNKINDEFTGLAVYVINSFYEDKKSYHILTRQLPNWEKKTCLHLSAKVRNKRFISQTPCQDILDTRWGNDVSVITCLITTLLLIIAMPITLLCLICIEDLREEMLCYFSKPKVKYIINAGSYFVFLGVFSYYMLVSFKPSFSSNEGVLCFWVFTFLCEEIRQFSERRNDDSITNIGFWNVLDFIAIIAFTSGMILRAYEDSFELSRVVMCFVLLVYFIRVLYIFLGSVKLGPQLVMIGRLVTQDLLPFVLIILIFVVAYAISSEALLYPNAKLSWKLLYHLPRKAYWQIYGELFLEDIEGESQCTNDPNLYDDYDQLRCPTEVGKYIAPVLLAIYIFLINVLLLNLLIAMFSSTITAIMDDSYPHWGYQRYERVTEYETRPILPPPFIFFEHLYRLIVCIRSCDCKNKVDQEPKKDKHGEALTDEVNRSYSRAEKSKAKKCVDLLKTNPQLVQNNYNHLPNTNRHQLTEWSATTDKEDKRTTIPSKMVEKSDVYYDEDDKVDEVDHSVNYEDANDNNKTRRSPITNDTYQSRATSGRVDIHQSLSQIEKNIQHLEQKIDSMYTSNRRDELKLILDEIKKIDSMYTSNRRDELKLILDEIKKIEAGQKSSDRQPKTVTPEIPEDDDYDDDYLYNDLPTYLPYRGQAKNKLLHSSLCFSNLAEYQRLQRLAVFRKSKKKKTKKTKTDAEDVTNTL